MTVRKKRRHVCARCGYESDQFLGAAADHLIDGRWVTEEFCHDPLDGLREPQQVSCYELR